MFTRQHYSALAKVFLEAKPDRNDYDVYEEYLWQKGMWAYIVAEFARYFKSDNDRFDHEKFAKACKLYD